MQLKAIIHSSKCINLRKITTLLRKKSSGMAKNSCNFTQVDNCKSTQDKKAKLRKFATLKAAINNISRAGGKKTPKETYRQIVI